jgi:hypothetical protein
LLTCMAFNVSVATNMPEVGYLVVSDKFFISTFAVLFLTLAETMACYLLDNRGLTERALGLDRKARVIFPIVVGLIFGYLLIRAKG